MSYFEQTRVADSSGTVINPAQDESVSLLRRIVKLLEPSAVCDIQQRQRVVVEAAASTAVTGTFYQSTQPVSIAAQPVDQRYEIMDRARMEYAIGIRNNITF